MTHSLSPAIPETADVSAQSSAAPDSPTAVAPVSARRRPGVLGAIRSGVLWVASLIGLLCIIVFVVCMATGMRPQVVMSGSMEPTLPTGSVLFVAPEAADQVAVGDIVTVPRPEGQGLVTHRVISVEGDGQVRTLTLQGDANDSPDPWTYPVSEVGRLVFSVPGVGWLVGGLRTPFGLAGVVVFGCALVAFFFLDPAGRGRRTERKAECEATR